MSREKQIEEIAYILDGCCNNIPDSWCETYACSTCKAKQIYNAGYRKQEWISVNERLPENELERVLVFLKDEEFTKPIGDNKIDTDRFIDGKWVRWGRYITHWMPLPEVPKMKGGAE